MKYPAFDGTQNCAEIGPELFFPINDNPSKHVTDSIKQMCYGCWFQSECLEWGLRHENEGWWGGIGPNDRQRLRRQLGIRLESVKVSAFLAVAS